MCIVSMVYDQYAPQFPWNNPTGVGPTIVPNIAPKVDPAPFDWTTFFQTQSQVEQMEKLIKEFKEALEHAKKLDILMQKPDCEDPEKAKLLERVEKLEAELAKLKKTPKKKTKK